MNTEVAATVAGTVVTVTVTSVPSVVVSQLRALKSSGANSSKLVVGLDVEWNSADVNANPALLQLCSGTRCLIVQLQHMPSIPPELKDFLADPNINFVGVGIHADVAKLQASYGLACAGAVELSTLAAVKNAAATTAAAGRGLAQLPLDVTRTYFKERVPSFQSVPSFQKKRRVLILARDVCGVSIQKSDIVARSDWSSSVLTNEQIAYGAADAYAAYLVGAKLLQAA